MSHFIYEEEWADWRLRIFQPLYSKTWSYQIEAWDGERHTVKTGGHGFEKSNEAIVTGRNKFFYLLIGDLYASDARAKSTGRFSKEKS